MWVKVHLGGRALVLFRGFSEVQIRRKEEIVSSSKNTLPTKMAFESSELWKNWELTRLEKMRRLFCLQALLAGPTVVDCFLYPTLEMLTVRFFPHWARSDLIYDSLRLTINWSRNVQTYIECLCTVLCMLRNWQKKNWKLNFQSDNVIVLKEILVFNMRYHVKLLVLGIQSTVEVECH